MRNIIDGNSLLFRAFYGVAQRLTRSSGTPVNAVYGFCNMILPLIYDAKDGDEFICVFDFERKNWRHDIYPEYKGNRGDPPDDLIPQFKLVRDAARAMGIPVLDIQGVEADDVIATLCQQQCPTRIISSDKDLMQLINDCVFIYDTMKNQELREPEVFEKFGVKPSQMIDCQSLIGDSSDNVPGVRGIGPKAASNLLNEFGTLENIYANIDNVKNERIKKLLIDGKETAFLSKKLVALKTDVVIPEYKKYEFNTDTAIEFFLKELESKSLAEKARKTGKEVRYMGNGEPYIFEESSSPFSQAKNNESEKLNNTNDSTVLNFNLDDYLGALGINAIWDKLIDTNIKKIGYDWKTIFHKMDEMGFDVSKIDPVEDTMLKEYAANSSPNIYEMDLAILRPLYQMEKNGILIDVKKLSEISEFLHKEADLIQTKIWQLAGVEFNIASPKQLAEILFDKMHLPTDKSRSTSADKLSDLAGNFEIVDLVLKWRGFEKLTGTYTDALPKSIGKDGRIHTTYLQATVSTGRLSSQNPNLQNIPIKSEMGEQIRECFIAAPGNVLISADYSQIQLRLLAHLADAKLLKDSFVNNKDIHSETAIKIFGLASPENRRIAKTINFSIIYGVSAFGLAGQLNIPRGEAQKIIDDYMNSMPEVKKYIDDVKQFATEHGYVDTYFGRRIMIPDINNPRLRNYALRAAFNAPIQGFEADIMRIAMAKLSNLPIKMVLQVHDEFVFEAPIETAEKYAKEIQNIMENIVELSIPIKADYKISERWSK